MALDRRDIGHPGIKEWEEFRAGYAAAFLFVWLIREVPGQIEEYAADLHDRFMSGWDISESLGIDIALPESERGFPLPPVGGVEEEGYETDLTWMDNSEAHALYDQLFPHGDSTRDFPNAAARMAVIALHSSLESYARGVGIEVRGSLPRALEAYLEQVRTPHLLDSVTMRVLVDCDATRNVIVHNRGVVDERYIRAVQYARFQIGEFRTVTAADLRLFAEAVWKSAVAIRLASESGG
jgi:hypothetical protein